MAVVPFSSVSATGVSNANGQMAVRNVNDVSADSPLLFVATNVTV